MSRTTRRRLPQQTPAATSDTPWGEVPAVTVTISTADMVAAAFTYADLCRTADPIHAIADLLAIDRATIRRRETQRIGELYK